jgi:DNA-binding transcriptional LysR family regulator
VEATPEWLFHELRERSLDLIILLTFDPVGSNDIVSEMLYEDRMVIVAPADNPWTRQSRVDLADLVDENWTLPEPEHPVTSIVASAFRAIASQSATVRSATERANVVVMFVVVLAKSKRSSHDVRTITLVSHDR